MYFAKVNWYDEFEEKDVINHVFIIANDWNEAMEHINKEFSLINSIEMTQLQSNRAELFYVPESMVDGVTKENIF